MTKYREAEYSITDLGNGRWRWKLHPKLETNALTVSKSGEAATQEEAIAAAKAAILAESKIK